MSHRYFFILGTTPELSVRELEQYFGTPVERVSQSVCIVDVPETITPGELMLQLGGTVKICVQKQTLSESASSDTLHSAIAEVLSTYGESSRKITFGIAEFGRNQLDAVSLHDVKDILEEKGRKVRFIEGPLYGLSAAILIHRPVTEVAVIKTATETVIAVTEAVQNIDAWTTIDREKPYADRKKGMLPPKIARIMVNLACGRSPSPEALVFDPFCGSGTILLEAAARGLEVIGSDLDKDAVEGSIQNLQWYTEHFGAVLQFRVIQADATKVQLNQKVQYLITEPFLGKPKPAAHQIPNIFKGLEKMYLGAFKHWKTLLAPGARVVIIFPRALSSNLGLKHDATLESLIDKLKALGYTSLLEPVLYHRPNAVIAREIRVFEYQPVQQ